MNINTTKNLWGLREEKLRNCSPWIWCSCIPRSTKITDVEKDVPITPILTISLPPQNLKPPYDSPSIKSIQRLSSGSESSGYFTPPPAERPNARVTTIDHCEPRSAVIPLSLPAVLQEIEDFCDSDTQTSQSEQPEYIEVIGSPFHLTENNNVEQEKLQTQAGCDETATDYNSNTSEPGEDQVDRKSSVSSLSNFDLTQRPFEEHRAWSKSEVHLEKTLPIIVSRKNVNSAPPIKDICNNNVIEKTSIVVETLLPGALIVDEEPPEVPLVRKLSKRYSHVPVARKSSYRVVKPETSGRSSSRQKDLVQEVLTQLRSPDWETTMVGLKGLSKLARNHTELLEPNMHVVSLTLATQIRNLRSQVARAACQAASEMFNTCSTKGLESELEEVAAPLLHRTADTNKFLREDANNALDAMSKNMPTNKVITFVTSKGCTHQNAIVRAVAARLLDDLVKKHGAEKIFSSGRDVRDRVFLAGANALTEGSLETRKYAKSLLKNLIPHPNFQKTLMEAVPPHTIRHIAKTLNSLK